MSNQKDQMKWVLFWVFLILFVLMVLGTLAMVFLGFGSPTESERELMVKGLIGEVAACIIALFYSIFGLKGGHEEIKKLQELEGKTDHVLSMIEHLKLGKNGPKMPPLIGNDGMKSPSSFTAYEAKNFESKTSMLDMEPPFPISEYELTPLPIDIKNDIQEAKPIDVKHRKSSYKGMKVQWKALLSTVEEKDENKLRITADLGDFVMYAAFDVDRNANNALLVADKDEPFWFCGEIIEAESQRIELDKVQVKF